MYYHFFFISSVFICIYFIWFIRYFIAEFFYSNHLHGNFWYVFILVYICMYYHFIFISLCIHFIYTWYYHQNIILQYIYINHLHREITIKKFRILYLQFVFWNKKWNWVFNNNCYILLHFQNWSYHRIYEEVSKQMI